LILMRSSGLGVWPVSAVALLGLFMTGCGASSEPNPAAGTYRLEAVEGGALPVVVVTEPCTGFADSGTLGLSDGAPASYDMTFIVRFQCANGPGATNTHSERGTWSEAAGTITFNATGGSGFAMAPASLSGSALTVSMIAPSGQPGVPSRRVTAIWRKQ
jgi:hypothetical protein